MTVKEIVKQYLEANGFDGLCRDGIECGCELSDLMPCDTPLNDCESGYKRKPQAGLEEDMDAEWVIGPKPKNIKADGGLDETVVDCVSEDGDRYNRLDVDWDRMEHVVHDIVPYLGTEDIKGNARALLQLKGRIDQMLTE